MKTYLRVLRFARELPFKLTFFLLYSVLGILFGTFNLVLLMPMLQVLFRQDEAVVVPPLPSFSLSLSFITETFDHYFLGLIARGGRLDALIFVCTFILVCILLANIFRYLERVMATKIRVDIVKNLRMEIFRQVSRQHIGFFNTERKGDLISRFTNDVNEVEGAVMNSLKAVLKEPLQILGLFVALFLISPQLTLFTLLVLPLTGGVIAEIIKRLKRQARQSQESLGRIVNLLDETFGGMRVVKAFNARNFVIGKMEEESEHFRKVTKSMAYKNELASPVSEILGVMIICGIIFFGGHLVLSEESALKPEAFLVFLGIFASVIQPAKNFSNGITALQRGTVAAQRIFSLIDLPPQIKSKPGAVPIKEFRDAIEFRNVSFAYVSEPVLKNVSLRVARGKTLALVGPSGGGKSTLADLVPRFYDPTSGEVCIDGIPLTEYDLESLRSQMGIVTQESILFNDTIFNNIAFGLQNAHPEEVMQAARVANAHDFIMETPEGYQTRIGERGSKLSGGQRQRISIARAVLRNPPILILDEATSALDSESERAVQDALFKLMQNRTSIVIAHRLSTIQHADEIAVVQQGMIVELGSHEQLLARGGVYRRLVDIQKAEGSAGM